MSRIRRTSAVAVAAAAATLVATTAADAHKSGGGSSSTPEMTLTDVTVLDSTTVHTTFSNPLAASNTDLSLRVFHAPHFDHDTPHSHEATSVTLLNEGRTARVTLDRALHPQEPLCDDPSLPRCSDDELDWVVSKATDIYGQTVSDDHWDVWAVGSKD